MNPVLNKVAIFRICSFTKGRQCGHTPFTNKLSGFGVDTILLTLGTDEIIGTGDMVVRDEMIGMDDLVVEVRNRSLEVESVPFISFSSSKQQLY